MKKNKHRNSLFRLRWRKKSGSMSAGLVSAKVRGGLARSEGERGVQPSPNTDTSSQRSVCVCVCVCSISAPVLSQTSSLGLTPPQAKLQYLASVEEKGGKKSIIKSVSCLRSRNHLVFPSSRCQKQKFAAGQYEISRSTQISPCFTFSF